jgi:hypothetical protein
MELVWYTKNEFPALKNHGLRFPAVSYDYITALFIRLIKVLAIVFFTLLQ